MIISSRRGFRNLRRLPAADATGRAAATGVPSPGRHEEYPPELLALLERAMCLASLGKLERAVYRGAQTPGHCVLGDLATSRLACSGRAARRASNEYPVAPEAEQVGRRYDRRVATGEVLADDAAERGEQSEAALECVVDQLMHEADELLCAPLSAAERRQLLDLLRRVVEASPAGR